jgi:hypothetical protein
MRSFAQSAWKRRRIAAAVTRQWQYGNKVIILANGWPVKALVDDEFYLEEQGTLW